MKLAQEAIERLAEHLERCELEARDTTKMGSAHETEEIVR
jgi:hypothetical protein